MRLCSVLICLAVAACGVEVAPAEDADASEDALAGYRVQVTAPSPITPGSTAQLSIRVLGAGSTPVTQFDDLHTQKMHVVAVSSDLQDFLHVHPILGDSGTLTVNAPIARAQPYKLFFEYDPAGPAVERTSRATLRPVGATRVAPALSSAPAFQGDAAMTSVAGSTRVELQPLAHGMIMPGMTTTLRVAIETASGAPATDLVDWLGMPGHAIVLSEDTSTFIHAHAMRPGNGGSGHGGGHGGHGGGGTAPSNVLDVDVKFPRAGFYKMFVQVKRATQVITAPFVLHVSTM